MAITPEGIIKRRQTMLAKLGSKEAYDNYYQTNGKKGGDTITENTKYRGGGKKNKESG